MTANQEMTMMMMMMMMTTIEMERGEEEPTLFKVKVLFPVSMKNTKLEYQFRAMISNRYSNEDISRSLRISGNDQTLNALYFNS